MNMKDTILKMPAWKAAICVLLLMLGIGVIFETILVHTVFHLFDRVLLKMDAEKKDDIADLDSISQQEQQGFCEKYQHLLEEKSRLANRTLQEKEAPDVDLWFMQDHENQINNAIKQHHLNLALCKKKLKSKSV